MKRPRIRCVDCGHGASRHYDPIRDSDRNVLCKFVNRTWSGPTYAELTASVEHCRCSLARRQVEAGESRRRP